MNAGAHVSRIRRWIALLALALLAAGARADAPVTPGLTFNGFGTLGLVHSSEDQADFVASTLKPSGAGHTRSWSGHVDSVIGAQLTATLTPRLSAVVQVVAEQNYDNSYRPLVEWANVRYQVTPGFDVRIGRIVLPAFMVSDYRKVGYINPWVRPPLELYSLIPVESSDGVDARYRVTVGEITHTFLGIYGRTETRIPGDSKVQAKGAGMITYTAELGATTLRAAYSRADLTVEAFNPLFDAFRQFGPEGIAIADRYDLDDKRITFIALGGMYDPGKWFVRGEWGQSDTNSVLGKATAWYVSGGYRLGDFTPYVTYARRKVASNTADPGLTVAALPPFLAGPAAGLNAALNATLGSAPAQQTLSLGGRWDFASNAALKLQFDHTRHDAGSAGLLSNQQPGFRTGGKVNVFSATIDFVF
ncbi:porin [Methyloversatilis sp.]|uniref:porin n=1 Tax=Methyloversatilis sp. TaxID=2569862 RepID=UPI0027350363|nr:porin [Methyloversatilis sp.]